MHPPTFFSSAHPWLLCSVYSSKTIYQVSVYNKIDVVICEGTYYVSCEIILLQNYLMFHLFSIFFIDRICIYLSLLQWNRLLTLRKAEKASKKIEDKRDEAMVLSIDEQFLCKRKKIKRKGNITAACLISIVQR